MQVCTLLQTDNHTSTPPLSFLQAGCPSCRPANSVKAQKANYKHHLIKIADKAKSRNNLLMKPADSSWGANANTLGLPR